MIRADSRPTPVILPQAGAEPTGDPRGVGGEENGGRAGTGVLSGWSAMVIAADNRSTDGTVTEAFDNARRDAAQRLSVWGVKDGDLAQYSVMPEAFPKETLRRLTLTRFARDLARLKMRTGEGCFFYMTSHGTEQGIAFNQDLLSPDYFWGTVERLCGRQPVVAVISACHSGVFAEERWQQPNRFILTAARADRTSFGCGKDNIYPYFDACFLKAARGQGGLADIAGRTRTCVAERETRERLLPSEPQLFIGAQMTDVF